MEQSSSDFYRSERKRMRTEAWGIRKTDLLFRCPGCGRTWGYRNHIMFSGKSKCPDCAAPFNCPKEISEDTLSLCLAVKDHDETS